MARYKGSRKPPGQKRPPLTHFLCLPLVTTSSRTQLRSSLAQFREDVASTINAKAIRPVGALHCTLGVMSLKGEKLQEATQTLEALDVDKLLEDVASSSIHFEQQASNANTSDSNGALSIDLKGLASMHASESTSILYVAPTDTSSRLYPFCLAVQKVFQDKDLLVKDDRPLKLHATMVNTIYTKQRQIRHGRPGQSSAGTLRAQSNHGSVAQGNEESTAGLSSNSAHSGAELPRLDDDDSGHGPNAKAPFRIDARSILAEYEDFVWAEKVVLDRIAICEMGAKKQFDSNGVEISEEYTEVAHQALPK